MFILFLCVHATTCVWRTICRNWFSPPTMWVLGVTRVNSLGSKHLYPLDSYQLPLLISF